MVYCAVLQCSRSIYERRRYTYTTQQASFGTSACSAVEEDRGSVGPRGRSNPDSAVTRLLRQGCWTALAVQRCLSSLQGYTQGALSILPIFPVPEPATTTLASVRTNVQKFQFRPASEARGNLPCNSPPLYPNHPAGNHSSLCAAH
jgi:hypothetical protein